VRLAVFPKMIPKGHFEIESSTGVAEGKSTTGVPDECGSDDRADPRTKREI